MKIVRGMGKIIKPFVNFPQWMGLGQITTVGKSIKDTAKSLAEKPKANRKETYEQAVARLHLSENDLKKRMQNLLLMAGVYCAMGALLFVYSIFLMFTAHLAAFFLSFVLTVVVLTLAFRQHFWYFQMKQRRLGCTVKEWLNGAFGGK
jgi:intracellular multiplication protein IcmV